MIWGDIENTENHLSSKFEGSGVDYTVSNLSLGPCSCILLPLMSVSECVLERMR